MTIPIKGSPKDIEAKAKFEKVMKAIEDKTKQRKGNSFTLLAQTFSNDCHDESGRFCSEGGPLEDKASGTPRSGPLARDEFGRAITKAGNLHGRAAPRPIEITGNQARVPLTDDPNGPKAAIDPEDANLIGKYRWLLNNDGHPYAKVNSKNVSMHQLLTGEKNQDHINRDKLDNRRANLRPASKSLNEANTGPRNQGTSGAKGVTWDKANNKWMAQISLGPRGAAVNKKLGRFDKINDAKRAYNKAAKEAWGEHAYQNPIHEEDE